MNKTKEFKFETPELDKWMRELERGIFWEKMKGNFPWIWGFLFIVVAFLSMEYTWAYLGLWIMIGAVGIPLSIDWDGLARPVSQPLKQEAKEVHHHHHHVVQQRTRMTEVREVRAMLPNGTEVAVRHGRKYE